MSERTAMGILEKLRDLAEWCQDETLNRERGHIELIIMPNAITAEIVIRAGERYTQRVQFTDQQLIELGLEFLQTSIQYAFDAVERAAR